MSKIKYIRSSKEKSQRMMLLLILDVLSFFVSCFAGLWLLYDFHFSTASAHLYECLHFVCAWSVLSITVFILCGLYNSIWSFASVDELLHILTAYGILALLGAGYLFWAEQPLPNSFYVISGIFCMVCTVTIRFSYRLMRSLKSYFTYFSDSAGRENVMIIGAGEAGRTLATELEKTSYVKTRVVCAIDDNAAKHGKRLCGVPIVGGREAIPAAVKEYKVHRIILAIPSCAPSDRKEILDLCATTGCKVQVVPGIYQLVNGEVSVGVLRNVEVQDLLGRDPVQVNWEEIGKYITGKRVMVTGGGGSIGSELCRQIARTIRKNW